MNTMSNTPKKTENFKRLIIGASIAIPLVVAVLFKVKIEGVDLSILPPVYASINGVTGLLLILALIAIKRVKLNFMRESLKSV